MGLAKAGADEGSRVSFFVGGGLGGPATVWVDEAVVDGICEGAEGITGV